jgi:hypothetical protein
MLVFVFNKHGKPLMPCSNKKARLLLKNGKARIISYKPFTIQLFYGSSGYKQKVSIGVDTGAKHIGVAINSENKVLAKGEIELRQDVTFLIETRKTYRRSRRNRKTRYRKARFLNRKRSDGWLPPSLQSRINSTFHWIDKFISLVPNPQLNIEVGKFDPHKMFNPEVSGKDYQTGQMYGFYDVRYFVFARDNYTCQLCKKKGGILRTHHIRYRSKGGTDNPNNLITVCNDCHTSENHKVGGIFWEWMTKSKKPKMYKEHPFMNILRIRIFEKYPEAKIVYGSWTTPERKRLGLEKTHYNDAIAISGIDFIKKNVDSIFKIKQFRKKKRSLHEATARKGRKQPNITQKRNSKNTKFYKDFWLNDFVEVFGKKGWITGFCSSGCYVKDIFDNYITVPNKSYKQVSLKNIKFINHNNNWQFIPHLKQGDFLHRVG